MPRLTHEGINALFVRLRTAITASKVEEIQVCALEVAEATLHEVKSIAESLEKLSGDLS